VRVLIQLRSPGTPTAIRPLTGAIGTETAPFFALGAETLGQEVSLDPTFAPIQLPTPVAQEPGGNRFAFAQPLTFSMAPEEATYLVRGELPDADPLLSAQALTASRPEVVGVFADPVIESCLVCPGAPPVGSDKDVARLLEVGSLAAAGMDGKDVLVAVVDSGINVAHLQSKGRTPNLNARKSWTPAGVATKPGNHPVDHGTMCAYDVGIAAPAATLLDYSVLLSQTAGATTMAGYLSDAVAAYSKLLGIIGAMRASRRALVVTNSWGMFRPSWDFPIGHPGNFSDNPAHPFNVIVASLENAGADILFAAGNCGRDCPDSRCGFGSTRPICGANSHPRVLSVAGIDVRKQRVGYSSQGPGRLSARKPDISAYTHFAGSGVYKADGGTSAACPVAAGVVAAIRAKYSASVVSPAQLRSLLYKTAEDLGGMGFDYDHGWGALDAKALTAALAGPRRPAVRRPVARPRAAKKTATRKARPRTRRTSR
jgi:subtilisin family serine protease